MTTSCAGTFVQETTVAPVDGRLIYERDCLACHMSSGGGVPGMIPTLIGSPWVTGSEDALIGFVLTGGFGPEVLMARFDFLTDHEMAAVLTYVRVEFGDGATAINTDGVTRVRSRLNASE